MLTMQQPLRQYFVPSSFISHIGNIFGLYNRSTCICFPTMRTLVTQTERTGFPRLQYLLLPYTLHYDLASGNSYLSFILSLCCEAYNGSSSKIRNLRLNLLDSNSSSTNTFHFQTSASGLSAFSRVKSAFICTGSCGVEWPRHLSRKEKVHSLNNKHSVTYTTFVKANCFRNNHQNINVVYYLCIQQNAQFKRRDYTVSTADRSIDSAWYPVLVFTEQTHLILTI